MWSLSKRCHIFARIRHTYKQKHVELVLAMTVTVFTTPAAFATHDFPQAQLTFDPYNAAEIDTRIVGR